MNQKSIKKFIFWIKKYNWITVHHAAKQTAQIKWYHHKIYWPVIASKAKVHEHFLVCSIFHSARGTVEAKHYNKALKIVK